MLALETLALGPSSHRMVTRSRAVLAVQKVSATSALVPINFSGSKTFSVRAIDEAGNAGAFGNTTISVTAPFGLTLTAGIFQDQVRLSWTVPTSTLPISEYIIMRGASNTVITRVSANTYTLRADGEIVASPGREPIADHQQAVFHPGDVALDHDIASLRQGQLVGRFDVAALTQVQGDAA